ncbi:MAG TPA: ethanolamine ammonia-lyase subunit EutC [Candidatus Angelobacter sp.]|jgi:ethanolamine ammonia-lyase small subunit|nr:ethanolamine ammonia-lyase subunit EutC [Candidatus Angelobacter sp.]
MDDKLQSRGWPDLIERIRARTPARVLAERSGAAYRTGTQLELRQAHAAARDAVRAELDLERDLGSDFVRQWKLFSVSTMAASKDEYLRRPDLGRRLDESARGKLPAQCPANADLQAVIGDGLSVTAVATQVPPLIPLIDQMARSRGWKLGRLFVVHYSRVGVINDVGELLKPKVVVLLIGERPGLATAQSLSAYMAYQPRPGHNDSNRNLISNIHARGVNAEAAASRIIGLAEQMMLRQTSGVELKEELPAPKWLK